MAKQEVYTFDNGATLIYQKQSVFNGSSVVFGFRSGAQLDGKYKGLSHLLEHLLFRDSKPSGTKKTLWNVLNYSINQNAYTSRNFICLDFSATNNNLENALSNLMDSVVCRKYTQEQIKLELDIVKQEINLHKDNAQDEASAISLLIDGLRHNNKEMSGLEILGNSRTLNMITPEILAEYKRRYFNTDNLIISVTSNQPVENIIELFNNQVFSRLPRAKSKKYIINPDVPDEFIRENAMCVLPNTPSYNVEINLLLRERDEYSDNPDKEFAYDMIEEYLMNDLGGIMYDALRIKNNLVYSYCLQNIDFGNAKFKNFQATTSPAKMRKTIKAICDTIYDIGVNGFPKDKFEAVKKAITDRENARLRKFKSCSARDNFRDYISNVPFIDYKQVIKYITEMTYDDFNNFVTSIYKAGNVSIAVDGLFDSRKMYRLIELEQMLGNFSHSDQLLDYNTPIIESTKLPEKGEERINEVVQNEFNNQLNEALAKQILENSQKNPTVTMDNELIK